MKMNINLTMEAAMPEERVVQVMLDTIGEKNASNPIKI